MLQCDTENTLTLSLLVVVYSLTPGLGLAYRASG
jgi:hypothetical protein